MTSEITAPPATEPRAQPSVESTMAAMDDAWLQFGRSVAGFRTMDRAVRTVKKQLNPGESPQGIPLLGHKGSANGVAVVELVCDLNATNAAGEPLMPQNAKEYILNTLMTLHFRQAADLLEDLQNGLDMLKVVFKGAQ